MTNEEFNTDHSYPDERLFVMQSFCGGGWIFKDAERTLRLFLGGEQIARVTDKQLKEFYEYLKATFDKLE